MFVYGTLKRGQVNHARFCQGALSNEEATVRGWLYELPFGFPGLVVPGESIYTGGTADPAHDTEAQPRLDEPDLPDSLPEGPRVCGELLVFDDLEERLPGLDGLEGFDPEEQSFYRRVLVPVEVSGRITLGWAYVMEEPSGSLLPDGRWPA